MPSSRYIHNRKKKLQRRKQKRLIKRWLKFVKYITNLPWEEFKLLKYSKNLYLSVEKQLIRDIFKTDLSS